MTDRTLRVLSKEDIARALPMADAVDAMKSAFGQLAAGDAVVPLRNHIDTPDRSGTFLIMPALLSGKKQMGVKILSLFNGNPPKGLPLIQALMVIADGETGSPLAMMDAGFLTALRTGAASGAATDFMARRDATRAAIFGAGVQGRTQLEAVCAVRAIDEAYVFDKNRNAAEDFSRAMSHALSIEVKVAHDASQAVKNAHIVCTATTSPAPVLDDGDLKAGVHINAVGAYTPETREIPGETVARARVVVDQRAACLAEAGDILIPLNEGKFDESHIAADLGELALGKGAGRTGATEITLFKSVGVAVQDVAAAFRAYENAEAMGLGARVSV